MYIRIARGTYDERRLDELLGALDRDYLPALKQAPGFRGFWSGHGAGRWATATLFDAEGQADITASLRGSMEAAGLRVESAEEFEVTRQAGDIAPSDATWLRVGLGSYDEGRADELRRIANEAHTPAVQRLPGFRGLVSGRAGSRSGTATFFNTPGVPERVPTDVMDKLTAAGFRIDTIEEFEIARHI